jgi:hypothetical protein
MRRHTAATALFFDLIEVFGDAELPPAAAAHPALACLRRRADNAVAWFNDLVSWRKELAAGDPHNLVLVVRDQTGAGLARAVGTVAAWHDAEVRAFRRVGSVLEPALLAQPGVRALVDGLAHWLRANVDWSAESGRYAPVERGLPQTG